MEQSEIIFRDCPLKRGLSGRLRCRSCGDDHQRPLALLNLHIRGIPGHDSDKYSLFDPFPAPCFPCGLYAGDCPLMIWLFSAENENPCRKCLVDNLNEPCFEGCPVIKKKEPCRICPNLKTVRDYCEGVEDYEKAMWKKVEKARDREKEKEKNKKVK